MFNPFIIKNFAVIAEPDELVSKDGGFPLFNDVAFPDVRLSFQMPSETSDTIRLLLLSIARLDGYEIKVEGADTWPSGLTTKMPRNRFETYMYPVELTTKPCMENPVFTTEVRFPPFTLTL
jgi:hypothetical protein